MQWYINILTLVSKHKMHGYSLCLIKYLMAYSLKANLWKKARYYLLCYSWPGQSSKTLHPRTVLEANTSINKFDKMQNPWIKKLPIQILKLQIKNQIFRNKIAAKWQCFQVNNKTILTKKLRIRIGFGSSRVQDALQW